MAGNDIDQFFEDYYRTTFSEHGASAKGVAWKDEAAQRLSFDYIVKLIRLHFPDSQRLSLLELGCGYGAFLGYLRNMGRNSQFDYYGIDLVTEMIDRARSLYPELHDHFVTGDFKEYEPTEKHDLVISSGVFNIRGDFSETSYEAYVLDSISLMFQRATKGIVFNMMTPAPTFQDPKLYYPKLDRLFNFIYNNLSRDVAIVSAYPLWKITIGVYK